MITVLQILFVLGLIILVILLVFHPRKKEALPLPENIAEILSDYVPFYATLSESGKKTFEERLRKFLSAVKVTGANAEVEDLDRVLIGAAAVIPVYHIPDWDYLNLREILLYPGHFNTDYDQEGQQRNIAGMVGNGALQNVMILSKWEVRQGFLNRNGNRNTAIHEFVHLVDGMDGTLDGVPEILLERKYVAQWKALCHAEMERIRQGLSDMDAYAATSPVEFFSVVAEYFFTQPETFSLRHPELTQMLRRIFIRRAVN